MYDTVSEYNIQVYINYLFTFSILLTTSDFFSVLNVFANFACGLLWVM